MELLHYSVDYLYPQEKNRESYDFKEIEKQLVDFKTKQSSLFYRDLI